MADTALGFVVQIGFPACSFRGSPQEHTGLTIRSSRCHFTAAIFSVCSFLFAAVQWHGLTQVLDCPKHMRYLTVRNHLKPYVIVSRRKTTINHAFAAAVAPSDDYDEQRVREAVAILGQDPDQDLLCAYCGAPAQTWDHVFATVKDSRFSGHGHRLGNLLPCCKPCNSAKGNKDWRRFLAELGLPASTHQAAEHRIATYLSTLSLQDSVPDSSPEYERLLQVRTEVLGLLAEADELAKIIRERQSNNSFKPKPLRGSA